MLRIHFLLWFFLLTFLSSFSCHAFNQERIISFNSNILIHSNAAIDITENIQVYSDGSTIQHGIVRTLPTHYQDSYGIPRTTHYHILQILKNGNQSTYSTKRGNNQFTIYIGDKRTLLSPGIYTYTIKYRVNKAINFLNNGDELYWNVTGNAWSFPIISAQATIQLPVGASLLNYSGYTGKTGSKEKNYSFSSLSNRMIFTTTQPLPPGEGLTVAVAWPKGFIQKPSLLSELKDQFFENPSVYIILEIAFILLIYYVLMWYWYGRNPVKGTIIPLYEPPISLSPAAIRYIHRMGMDIKTYTVTLISMATKGYISINNDKDTFTLIKKNNGLIQLSDEEEETAAALFPAWINSVMIDESQRSEIQKAKNDLEKSLAVQFKGKYFITNTGHFLVGIGFSLLAFITAILSSDDIYQAGSMLVGLSIWTLACGILLNQAWINIHFSYQYSSFKSIFRAFSSLLFATLFLLGEYAIVFIFSTGIPVFIIPLLFLILTLNIIFYILLKAPTPEGQKIMNQIEGFKLFLKTSERYRLNLMNPPDTTPELFEKYLPYAIALDVENEWGEQFNHVLNEAGNNQTTYQPTWYCGGAIGFTAASIASFPAYLNSGLSSAIFSASASSSSSASGGGGSSGGGGGGGGGGGW